MSTSLHQAWERVRIPEDPDWQEWRAVVMSPRMGRASLKVWLSTIGWRASMVRADGRRVVTSFRAPRVYDASTAKEAALDWAMLQPRNDKDQPESVA